MEDDTQWMDDLPDLGPSLPELDLSLPWDSKQNGSFRAITFTKDYNEIRFIHINILFFLHMNL
jgi:hypothetical protein